MTQDVFGKWCDTLGPKLVESLKSRRFEAQYCKTAEQAVQAALALIPQEDTVSWGGGMTLEEIGLLERVAQSGRTVLDRDATETPEARAACMRQALTCGTFLTSVNAISEDGVMVNIDGVGNRVAAMTFGPRQVIVIVGMNKVCPTREDAHTRARHFAAPLNAARLGLGRTPCAVTGGCGDCKSEECICSFIVETRMCRPAGRIKVILVGESLGY